MIAWELYYIRDCFFYGLFLSLIYDCLRIFRIVFPHGVFGVAIEDICYWFFAACGMFNILYKQDDGRVRWFAIAAVFLAMFLMNQYISKYLVPVIGKTIAWPLHFATKMVKKGFEKAKKCAIKPLKSIARWIRIKNKQNEEKHQEKQKKKREEREKKQRLEQKKSEEEDKKQQKEKGEERSCAHKKKQQKEGIHGKKTKKKSQ